MVDTPANTVFDPAETSYFDQCARHCGRIDRLKQALVGAKGQYRTDVEAEIATREATLEALRLKSGKSKADFAKQRERVCKAIDKHGPDWKKALIEGEV